MPAPFLIADDLSGALEAGAPFLRGGWQVSVPLEPEAMSAMAPEVLLVLSTETRNAAPALAAARVRSFLRAAKTQQRELLFKKIDSTLRGPVGAELAVLLAEFPERTVHLCPANPATRRVVCDGKLFVDGVPLELSAFRHDPRAPVETSDIVELLRRQGVAARQDGPAADLRRERVVVCDAKSEEDVQKLVLDARAHKPSSILVGSAAIAVAMAASLPGSTGHATPLAAPGAVILSASLHPVSARQLDVFAASGAGGEVLARVVQPPGAVAQAIAAARRRARAVALRLATSPGQSAEALLTWIAQLTAALGAQLPDDALLLTGGDTAAAACRALDGVRLDVNREFEPGVIGARLTTRDGRTRTVVVKPGAYGQSELWLDLVTKLVK